MITTDNIISVEKTLRHGVVTNYTSDGVSLFVRHNGEEKRFNATSVTNSSLTSSGLVTFSNIELWGDGSYSFSVFAENNTDLDINGVGLDKLATGYVKKITNESVLKI